MGLCDNSKSVSAIGYSMIVHDARLCSVLVFLATAVPCNDW